ncbi:MAG TPA: metalloregulator ArsR/SmtB family transcription factor [Gemmatimonadales bacterium]|nr:metalloregulator ArsR/SmtB family transcription factor [Gemmatimonadales bacterium]
MTAPIPTTPGVDLAQAAALFHALSDETRLAVLEMLRGGERCVCELQDALGAAQSRLSFHLKVLKAAGLVTDRREGRWAYYALVPGTLGVAHDVIRALGTDRVTARRGLKVFGRCCSA